MCASLYGIAAEQGWADVHDRVATTRHAWHATAQFQHVLTMTGTCQHRASLSPDTLGTNCLDTLQDFIAEQRGHTSDWMQRYYFNKLGVELLGSLAGSLMRLLNRCFVP